MRNRKFAIIPNRQEISVPKPANSRIYLDHAATTPIRPEALAAMQDGFAIWANPSSPHAEGRKAKQALEDARARVKAALGWDGEVIFTSGASEAAALALSRSVASERFVSAVEHDCIHAAAIGAPRLAVGADGAVDLEKMVEILAKASAPLVAIQSLNSETGNWQNHGDLTDAVHDAGGLVLADCAQSAGKMPIPHEVDMAVISGHKFGAPVGIGALLVRDYAMLAPSGGHERGYRRGTENLPGVLGMAAALELNPRPGKEQYGADGVWEATRSLAEQVRETGGIWFGDQLDAATAQVHAIAMPELSGQAQLMRFDLAGISISQGSACSSGTLKSSPVLAAMGVDEELAARTIRMSVGWSTTPEEVVRFTEIWTGLAGGR